MTDVKKIAVAVQFFNSGQDRSFRSRKLGNVSHETRKNWVYGFINISMTEAVIMPEKKSRYTKKEDRQAEHIKDSEKERGKSDEEAERIAYATVNKQKSEKKKDS